MKKSTVLKVIGVFAIMDLVDIAAKGQTISYARYIAPEVGNDWKSDRDKLPKLCKVRFGMIDKIADFWDFLCDIMRIR